MGRPYIAIQEKSDGLWIIFEGQTIKVKSLEEVSWLGNALMEYWIKVKAGKIYSEIINGIPSVYLDAFED